MASGIDTKPSKGILSKFFTKKGGPADAMKMASPPSFGGLAKKKKPSFFGKK